MILVGCPVYDRNWILPTWFEHVQGALEGQDFEYVFALDYGDVNTLALIDAHAAMDNRRYHLTYSFTPGMSGERNWHNPARLQYMTDLRNELLSAVRKQDPEYFLSLDSDILITKESFDGVLAAMDTYDAVAGKTFLGKGSRVTNAASYSRSTGLKRSPAEYLTHVDVIMAYKLMNRRAYGIDYKYNHLGEDIGWSMSCRAEGLKLGFDGSVAVKHVMDQDDLDKIDKRVGY